jgi:hypothetical protein
MKTIFFVSLTTAAKSIEQVLQLSELLVRVRVSVLYSQDTNFFSTYPLREARLFQLTLLGFALCEAMGLLAI